MGFSGRQLELKQGWAGSPSVLCTDCAMVSHLDRSGYESGGVLDALHLCCLDKMTGAVVDTIQGCPSTHCAGAALMGMLGLLCARGLKLTKIAGQPVTSDPVPLCTIEIEGKCKQRNSSAPPNQERVSATPLSFGRVLGLVPLCSICFLKLQLFFCAPGCLGLI